MSRAIVLYCVIVLCRVVVLSGSRAADICVCVVGEYVAVWGMAVVWGMAMNAPKVLVPVSDPCACQRVLGSSRVRRRRNTLANCVTIIPWRSAVKL